MKLVAFSFSNYYYDLLVWVHTLEKQNMLWHICGQQRTTWGDLILLFYHVGCRDETDNFKFGPLSNFTHWAISPVLLVFGFSFVVFLLLFLFFCFLIQSHCVAQSGLTLKRSTCFCLRNTGKVLEILTNFLYIKGISTYIKPYPQELAYHYKLRTKSLTS